MLFSHFLYTLFFVLSCSSWNEATHGRPHANDAWASNDETSSSSHDGAHSTRNDPTR
jgi:hypothetical protein